ncbi:bacteriohopanetetrol glucosamine biosynthesis glycosyltransferase HpnI [Acidicapsa ligni]|uniref:bacteriohopanetetrol glucosamine biosynthesis glycosyltransferase HpnI n=1 Tax=Acidicapsa ligni TaxID=542300 RepID=UPI0021DFF09A|nr:bacteriohopanetetrol glucosamine biosynthesis glycosyltransferase HpnI [Acidicapsa ligni]
MEALTTLAHLLQIATTILVVASMGYCLLVLVSAVSFRLYARQKLPEFAPPISIFKPVKGLDPGMYEAFRSHCLQQYAGDYELLFGAGSHDDPAVEAVHRLIAEFPERRIKFVICPERLGTNGKVSNLIQMLPHAQHEFLLINDSDILVSPRYLERVMRQFAAPLSAGKAVGMVTALYRGRAHKTFGSILEALGIATDFQAGVLTAKLIERGIHFGLGSTLAVRREALAAAGGFEALVDQLADDYEMGARIDRAGYGVRLATEVVETSVPAYDWTGFCNHQLRWARTVRDSRRWGYVGLIFTHILSLAAINVLASGASLLSLWLFVLVFFLRLGTAMQVGAGVLADRQVLQYLLLLPLRDAIGFAIWIWSFAGNTIVWRGERFVLRNGQLVQPIATHRDQDADQDAKVRSK